MGNINISKDSGSNNGSFTISAKTPNNTIGYITSTVRVTNADGRYQDVTFIQKGRKAVSSLSANDVSINNGQQEQIHVTVTPNDALYDLTYEVIEGAAIATVSPSGVVTGTGIGTARVKITDTVSGKTTTITVTVGANGYTVTKNATHCIINGAGNTSEGATYTATITADSGYDVPSSITVIMGGTTLAASAYTYSNGSLSIPNVSGNIVITATSSQHEFTVTPLSIEVEYNNTSAQSVTVRSNANWTVAEQ